MVLNSHRWSEFKRVLASKVRVSEVGKPRNLARFGKCLSKFTGALGHISIYFVCILRVCFVDAAIHFPRQCSSSAWKYLARRLWLAQKQRFFLLKFVCDFFKLILYISWFSGGVSVWRSADFRTEDDVALYCPHVEHLLFACETMFWEAFLVKLSDSTKQKSLMFRNASVAAWTWITLRISALSTVDWHWKIHLPNYFLCFWLRCFPYFSPGDFVCEV